VGQQVLQERIDTLADALDQVKEHANADAVRALFAELISCKSTDETRAKLKGVQSMLVTVYERGDTWPADEFTQLRSNLVDAFSGLCTALAPTPPKKSETSSGTYAGYKVTYVEGNPADAERVAKGATELADRFESRLVARDYESAYAMIATPVRESTTLKRFISNHEREVRKFGGELPVAFEVQEIRRIHADPTTQNVGNSQGEWPKQMPRNQKRATIQVFVTTRQDPVPTGCWSFLWVCEESAGEFRIAKFSYYAM
jgi:hypothetical protein